MIILVTINLKEKRKQAKIDGDSSRNLMYKLLMNTTYGGTLYSGMELASKGENDMFNNCLLYVLVCGDSACC